MNKSNDLTAIKLADYQIGFYPELKPTFKFLGIFSFVIVFLILFSKYIPFLREVDGGILTAIMLLATLAFMVYTTHCGENTSSLEKLFLSKLDKDGKTREDKVREFWEKVLSSQNEIKIENADIRTEDYTQTSVLEKNIEIKKFVKMLWRGMVLFERNHEGHVTHLEGMPSILMLR